MKATVLVSLCFSVLLLTVKAQLDPDVEEQIIRYVEDQFMPQNNVPGMSIGVVTGDGRTFYMGFGYRNVENQLPVTGNTVFAIASISKSFTATLVVKTLAEKFPELGEAALDTPLAILAPGLNFTFSDRYRAENMNFRDLLSHRACLNTDVNLSFSSRGIETKEEFFYRQRYAEDLCPFRTQFTYSNAMIIFAGVVIEHIAEKPFETMVDELLVDLGMYKTTYIKDSDDHNNMVNRSLGYYRRHGQMHVYNSELLKRRSFATGSGGMLSCAADITRYMRFHLNYGYLDGVQVVPEHAMRWLHKHSNMFPIDSWKDWTEHGVLDGDYGHGLGFFLGLYNGEERVSHGGYLPPFESAMKLYPRLGLGIFTTMNGPGTVGGNQDVLHKFLIHLIQYGETTEEILRKINLHPVSSSDRYERPKFSEPFFKDAIKTRSRKGKINPIDVVGEYGNPVLGELTISLAHNNDTSEEQLFLDYGVWTKGWLNPTEDETFFQLEIITDLLHEHYATGGDGSPLYIDFFQDGELIFYSPWNDGSKFFKDRYLEDWPSQPWDPTSCSPSFNT